MAYKQRIDTVASEMGPEPEKPNFRSFMSFMSIGLSRPAISPP